MAHRALLPCATARQLVEFERALLEGSAGRTIKRSRRRGASLAALSTRARWRRR